MTLLADTVVQSGFKLSSDDIQSLEILMGELKKWNKTVNLTALIKDMDIISKHIIDSLSITPYLAANEHVLDVGSGAGFPALPVSISCPGVSVVSVDAVQKKIMFQKHIVRKLHLKDITPLHCRVESMYTDYAGSFDVIISRAFSRLDHFVALVQPLLKNGGRIIAMKGPRLDEELQAGGEALQALGFEISDVVAYGLPFKAGERCLITLKPCI